MRIETRTGSIGPGGSLPKVLTEIIGRIALDDWCRYAKEEGNKWFYIIGNEAYREHEEGEFYAHLEVPQQQDVGPLARWYVNAQIARRHTEGADAWKTLPQKLKSGELLDPEKKARILLELLDSLYIDVMKSGAEPSELPDELRSRIEVGREKLCLQEIGKKYAKMVDRWEQLERLSFEDPQLEEASRCYLYGFYRATIVLSAAVVETELKRVTGKKRLEDYKTLVKEAILSGKLDSAFELPANDMFKKRNEVLHEGGEPKKDLAMDILERARQIVSALKEGVERSG